MSEKAPSGPKAKYNQETGEWENLRPAAIDTPPTNRGDLANGPISLPVDTLPPSPSDELDPPVAIPETPATAEETIAKRPNAELLYSDAELLGRHYPVRAMVREMGNVRTTAIEGMRATWKNMLDQPGRFRTYLSLQLAKKRVARSTRRYNELGDVSDDNIIKQHRWQKRHDAIHALDAKQMAYDYKEWQMKKRSKDVLTNQQTRHDENIKTLKTRRDLALGRKALRTELRTVGLRREASAELKRTSKQQLAEVGNLASIAKFSQKRANLLPTDAAKHTAAQHATQLDKALKDATKV